MPARTVASMTQPASFCAPQPGSGFVTAAAARPAVILSTTW